MSDRENLEKEIQKAAIEGFEVQMRLDCTVRIGGKDSFDFVKPGASASVKFSTIPTESQLRASIGFMNGEVLEPTLEDVLVQVQEKLRIARGGS